jgi:hypothetical protein
MSERVIQASRRYTFEVELEINNALALTPGELSTYLLDALFAMDCEGTLIPGLTQPEAGAVVLSGCVAPIGYRRGVDQGTYGEARRTAAHEPSLGEQPVTRSPEDIALLNQLEPLWLPLSVLFKEERLFQAKLFGMLDLLRSTDPLTDADRQQAEQLFNASQALFRHHAKTIKPML